MWSGKDAKPGGSEIYVPVEVEAKLQAVLTGRSFPTSQFSKFEHELCESKEAVMTESQAPPLEEGYGAGGESVQDPKLGQVFMSDRVPWAMGLRVSDLCCGRSGWNGIKKCFSRKVSRKG